MPLVFQVVFLTVVISLIESIGGGVGGGGRWEAVSGLKQALKHKGQCCTNPYWHNSQGKPGLPLESVWHPMQPYYCPSGVTQAMKCTLMV